MKTPGVNVGNPLDRLDARLKVTRAARYAAEHPVEGLVYAVRVPSTVASARIVQLDTAEAEKSAGVLAVITHLNQPKLQAPTPSQPGGTVKPRSAAIRDTLLSDTVLWNGQ